MTVNAIDRDVLRDKLSETETIYKQGMDQSTIMTDMEKKINEVMALKAENSRLRAELIKANEYARLAEAEYAFEKDKMETEFARLKAKEKSAKNDEDTIENLKSICVHLQNRVERRNAKIAALEQQVQQAGDVELQKTRNRLLRATRQIEKLKVVEANNQELDDTLTHCETEFTVLNDVLGLRKRDSFSGEWILLRKATWKAVTDAKAGEETALRLSLVEQKLSQHMALKKDESETIDPRAVSKLKEQLTEANRQIENAEIAHKRGTMFAEQQRIRGMFSKTIAQSHTHMISMVTRLHSAVTDDTPVQQLRPFLLAVVFITRWSRLTQKTCSSGYDALSLLALATMPSVTIDGRIECVARKFAELTGDLTGIKTKMCQEEEATVTLKKEIAQLTHKTGEGMTEMGHLKALIERQNSRAAELQRELALSVQPSRFEEALSTATGLELEVEKKEEEMSTMRGIIEEKSEILDQLSLEIKTLNAEKETRDEEIADIQEVSEKRCAEIEFLKVKLREKTKEILSLERLVNQMKPLTPSLMSIEDADDSDDSSVTDAVSRFHGSARSDSINPLFLGRLKTNM